MASTPVATLPQQVRQGPIVTQTVTVPANQTGDLVIRADIPTVDYENTANSLSMNLEVWRVADANNPVDQWRNLVGTTWSGGRRNAYKNLPLNPLPELLFHDLSTIRGLQIRGTANVPTAMTIGFTVSIVT